MKKTQRLGDALVTAGLITQAQLDVALQAQRDYYKTSGKRQRLGQVLTESGVLSEESLAHALSLQLGIPFIDLSSIAVDPQLVELVPRRLAERYQLVPVDLSEDGILVAMSDPTDVVALDDVRVAARAGKIKPAVATASAVREAVDRFYSLDAEAAGVVNRLGVAADIEVINQMDEPTNDIDDVAASHGAPIVRLANAIVVDAVRARATDVHIEPQEQDVKVRYRIDGLLREVMTIPKSVQGSLVSRIKIIAGMDISERRRPQDGRGRVAIEGHDVAMRVSTIPTMRGEKVVIRLLRQGEETIRLEQTGFDSDELSTVVEALRMPQGFVLFTGPTGSGKTTTLYASLMTLLSPEVNVVTLEDPIEYQIPGINQIQIDERTGVTFARGLRSVLRQDPNVIMVGEIRDLETAQIALQSAMTGHLVLSTVHTNDAPSAVTRLVDLGVEPFLVASALTLVVGQRLVRVICSVCKEETQPSQAVLQRLGLPIDTLAGMSVYRGAGCDVCSFTGFRGRTGLYEVLPITRQIREQINAQSSVSVIAASAKAAGMRTLLDSGIRKVREGLTTLEEVLRAVQVEQQQEKPRCPSCRHEIERSFVVCPYCQFQLGALTCPSCSREVMADWTVCPYCRTDLPRQNPSALASNGSEKSRLLIADDDESLRALVKLMFSDDYDVTEADGGEDVLRRAAIERPDVILLDLHMPDMSGIEVAKRLRSAAATSMIPLIVLTGDESSEIETLRAGVDDYITKPFDEHRLRARVERVLRAAKK